MEKKRKEKEAALKVEGVLVGAMGEVFLFSWDRMHRREAMRNGLAL